MKRLLILLLILPFVATSGSAQLLYRISGNGLDKPSYIYGTYHFASEKFVDEVPGLRSVLMYVDQVCGEVEDYSPDSNINEDQMMMPEGFSYDQVLDAQHYDMLNSIFVSRLGYDLSTPELAEGAGRMKPIVLSEMLLPLLEPVYLPGIELDLEKPLDAYFPKYAQKNGLSITGLETVDMQMEMMLGRPFEEQLAGLIWWLDNRDLATMQSVSLVKAYFAQDINSINDVFAESLVRYDDEFIKIIIDERNLDWMEKMPSIMEDKPTLFFVGVGHLSCGDCGILKLLEDAGYDVTPVCEDVFESATFKGGGLNEFRRWFMEHLKYPKSAMENAIQGEVKVEFVVDENGEVCRFKVLQSPDPLLSDAVISTLQKSPKWKPGKLKDTGENIKMKFVLPVMFKVQN